MNYKIILSSIAAIALFSGCSIKGGPVKFKDNTRIVEERVDNVTSNTASLKTIDSYFMKIKPGETLNEVLIKVRQNVPQINLFVEKNVNVNSKIDSHSSFNNITFKQFLAFLNRANPSHLKYSLVVENGVHILKLEENKIFKENSNKELKNIIKEENIKKFKKYEISLRKNSSYYSVFNTFFEVYKIKTKYNISNTSEFLNKKLEFDYTGSLYDFVNSIATENLLTVDYSSGITFTDYETKIFKLDIPQFYTDSTQVKSDKVDIYQILEEQLTKGLAMQELKYNLRSKRKIEPLAEGEKNAVAQAEDTIAGQVYINKSTKAVTVTGRPDSLAFAEKIIKEFNETYSKAVNFKITFFEVTYTSNEAFGVDISGLIGDLVSKGLAKLGSGTIATAVSDTKIPLISNSLTLTGGNGTTKAIVNSLNKYGKVNLTQSPSFMSLNEVPYFFNKKRNRDYVRALNETITEGSTITTNGTTSTNSDKIIRTPETESIETGFSLVVKPSIDRKTGDIYVTVAPDISNLNSLTAYTYESGLQADDGTLPKNTIYLKDTSSLDLGSGQGQTVKIRNGETTIIGGFMTDSSSNSKEGLPGTKRDEGWLDSLFSTKSQESSKTELLIVITANTID